MEDFDLPDYTNDLAPGMVASQPFALDGIDNENSAGNYGAGSAGYGGLDSDWQPVELQDGSTIYQANGSYIDALGNPVTSTGQPRTDVPGTVYGNNVVGANNDITKWLNSTLGTKLTDKQVTAMGLGAGTVAGLMGAMNPTRNPVGFQGSVDMSRQAVRQQIPQSATPREYGGPAMGRRYFTDTQYTNPAGLAAAQANATQQAQNIAAQQAEPVRAAQGGLMGAAKGRYLRGETDGMSDEIRTTIDNSQPAALSHGEFIIPADVVSHLGNGNSDAGAKKLKEMMSRIRKARTGTTKQGKEIDPNKFMPGGLASKQYAEGGAVQRFNTGGLPSNAPSGTALSSGLTGTESNLSNWAGPYVTGMLGQGQALANSPYQAYSGPLTAGSSPLQQQAFQGASNLSTPTNMGGFNAQSFTGEGTAQQYMNPYLKMALDPQMAELQRQNDIANTKTNSQFTQAGAFGGGRQAVANAENQRNMLQQMNSTLGQGYANAYDKAAQQFNTEQQAGQQAQALTNRYGLDVLGQQAGLGATQRGAEQEAVAADKAQFEEERANPYKMVQFQQSLLQGLPLAAQNYNVAQPSLLQQAAGGTSGLATLLGNFGYTLPGA